MGPHTLALAGRRPGDWWVEAGPSPALQERARDGWSHKADCEYFVGGPNGDTIITPRRDPLGKPSARVISPICSCGCGEVSLHGTPFFERYAKKYPEGVAHFARLAVSPLFPVFTPPDLVQMREVSQQATTRTATPLRIFQASIVEPSSLSPLPPPTPPPGPCLPRGKHRIFPSNPVLCQS